MPRPRPRPIFGFPPIVSPDARSLVLGSMPSVSSLEEQQYYAHPQNAFWPIVAELLGFDRSLPYEQRAARLNSAGIALWDVVGECLRDGSLDSAIRNPQLNDFPRFFEDYPLIDRVFFNGKKAQNLFQRFVLPLLDDRTLALHTLPSTSPANTQSRHSKLDSWRILVEPIS